MPEGSDFYLSPWAFCAEKEGEDELAVRNVGAPLFLPLCHERQKGKSRAIRQGVIHEREPDSL